MTHNSGKWTLFLDRDGVINKRKVDGYVTKIEEFELLPGVIDALKEISSFFHRIFIITNQQGVGKGIMTIKDLLEIQSFLQNKLRAAGIHIHGIFFCPHLEGTCFCRKPAYGMIRRLVHIFTDVNPRQSVFVGDDIKDILLAIRIGSKPVFIGTHSPLPDIPAFKTIAEAKNYIISLRTISNQPSYKTTSGLCKPDRQLQQ